jgi:hypothetical protein
MIFVKQRLQTRGTKLCVRLDFFAHRSSLQT